MGRRPWLLATLGEARVAELESSLEDQAQCPVCMDVLDEPVATAPCGHGPMCCACLRVTLQTNQAATGAEHGACPICREPVDDSEGGGGVLSLRAEVLAMRDRARNRNLGDWDSDDEDANAEVDEAKDAVARVLERAAAAGRKRKAAEKKEKKKKKELAAETGDVAAGKRPEVIDGDDEDGDGDDDGDDDGDEDGDGDDEIADSAKITAVLEEIASVRDAALEGEQPEQTVLFSQFTTFLDIVGPKIEAAGHSTLRLDGTQPLPTRARVVQAFRRGEANVLLVSLKAASLGLNLNCASRVILVDPWWNAAIEDQAIDRCHRIGQTREVVVTRMLVRDTVEGRIDALQEKKRAIATAALGDGADSLRAMRQRLSLRDLQDLFGRQRPGGAAAAEDDSFRCRCGPGRCLNCMCVALGSKCTPACGCGGVCANANDVGAPWPPGGGQPPVGPFGNAPPPPRPKREPGADA